MKKLNSVIYNKLLLQAEEAKEQEMKKLASGILEAIGSFPSDSEEEYAYEDLKNEIYKDLWKISSKFISYYNLTSLDATKLDKTLVSLAEKLTDEIEKTLEVDEVLSGPFEPKVIGEESWYI